MEAFITFNKGLLQSRLAVKIWLLFLMAVNIVAPIFMIQHRVATAVLAAFMLSMALMTILTARFGFTRILGLGHILWIPLSFYLLAHWPDYPPDSPIGLWLRLVTLTNLTSLVIDTTDVIRYLRGNRKPMA